MIVMQLNVALLFWVTN